MTWQETSARAAATALGGNRLSPTDARAWLRRLLDEAAVEGLACGNGADVEASSLASPFFFEV